MIHGFSNSAEHLNRTGTDHRHLQEKNHQLKLHTEQVSRVAFVSRSSPHVGEDGREAAPQRGRNEVVQVFGIRPNDRLDQLAQLELAHETRVDLLQHVVPGQHGLVVLLLHVRRYVGDVLHHQMSCTPRTTTLCALPNLGWGIKVHNQE